MEPDPPGWDDGHDGNNDWDLNAVLRFGGRGPNSPPPNNPAVARYAPPPPPPPELSYAATVLFLGGLGHQHQAIPAPLLPLPQAPDQDPPHADAAARWSGPSLDLPLLPEPHYTAGAAGGTTPEHHQAPPLNPPPWPRNEIPVPPSSVQRPAVEHTTTARSYSASGRDAAEGSSSRSKTRKDKDRKVIMVLADDPTPPDSWAWRKYGEKSTKDTPHHRSYYRCSTDRNCKARKHVQRCLNETGFLAVSYIGEHCHPMPLVLHSQAGTTRPKTPPPRQQQPTSPFMIRNGLARENQNQPLPPSAPSAPAATSPFAKAVVVPAAQGQLQTPAMPASVSASALASLLPAVSAPPPLKIQDVEQPPQPSAMQPFSVPIPAQKTPLPLPPSPPVIEIPSSSRESQPQAPALLAPVPYSLSPSPHTPLPPSPLLITIPAVEEQQQTPAQPANTPLPPVMSPLLSFQAEERATQVVPAPVLPPSVSAMPPTTLLPPPSVEFDNEEDDDDAVAVRMLLKDMDMPPEDALPKDMDMTPEDALMFANPEEEEEPLDGVGVGVGDGLLIQKPADLAPSFHGDQENMIYPMAYEPAPGGSGSNNSLMFPPVPYDYDYEAAAAAAALGSDGSTWTGAGAGIGAANVVNEINSPRHDERLWYWEW